MKTTGEGSKTKKMPALFIGHGSPMNILLENSFTESLVKLGRDLPQPKAIMVISAHWLTRGGVYVTCGEKHRTIHDFYGFPEELYKMEYPSPGSPHYARLVKQSVKKAQIRCDYGWGLDHASWAILKRMYPRKESNMVRCL